MQHIYLDRLSSQNEKRLGSLRQESGKLVYKDVLDFVGLLDLDAYSDRVDARLDEDPLVFVARNRQRRQEDLGRRLGLNLGDIVSLGRLRRKVGEGQSRRQAAADALEVGTEGLRLGCAAGQHMDLCNYLEIHQRRLTMATRWDAAAGRSLFLLLCPVSLLLATTAGSRIGAHDLTSVGGAEHRQRRRHHVKQLWRAPAMCGAFTASCDPAKCAEEVAGAH